MTQDLTPLRVVVERSKLPADWQIPWQVRTAGGGMYLAGFGTQDLAHEYCRTQGHQVEKVMP